MSAQPEAHLSYGYHLGGDDYGTHIEGETPDWLYGYPQDYLESVYRDAERPSHLVQFIAHGQHESKGYVLAASASVKHSDEGSACIVGLDEIGRGLGVRAAWDLALAEALELLGIKPTQEYPEWVLTSYYG